MVVLKRRSVLVTFRVSAEEHEGLKRACLKCGARSIADFARAAALQKVHTLQAPEGNIAGDLMTVSEALRDLDTILADTRGRIRAVLGPAIHVEGEAAAARREAGRENK